MGLDIYACAALGVKVSITDLAEATKVKAFDHSYSEDMVFCPQTGKKLWKDTFVLKKFFNLSDKNYYTSSFYKLKFHNYDVIDGNNSLEIKDSEKEYIICFKKVKTESHRKGSLVNFSKLENDFYLGLDEYFKQINFIFPNSINTFGLYSILEPSY